MKDNKIEISEIKVKIGKKEVILTPDELRDLHKTIGDLLGEEGRHDHHYYHYNWNHPIYYYPIQAYPTPYWTVTCGTGLLSGTTVGAGNVGSLTLTNTAQALAI